MAKSSKLEDYWRQHNIESLFKELTHTLVQRMPSDPAVALVQQLQKKFPKSFKTSTDNTNNMGSSSKTMANTLQSQSMTSPRSDVNIENTSDIEMRRRTSTQSQVSGSVTIPTAGSAFTDLLKQDTSSSKQAPELNIRNLVFANRLSQQVFKMGKDIRSDHDILDEELIKPNKTKANISSMGNASIHSFTEDSQQAQTNEQPSVRQLIKYKQQIRTENDLRLHRQKLAELAKQARDREQMLQSDLPTQPIGVNNQQQQKSGDDHMLSQVVPNASSAKVNHKPIANSKEEEEILDDENIFKPRRQLPRERTRNKPSTSRSNTPYIRGRDMGSSMPMMQFGICKVCKKMMSNENDQSISNSQSASATQTARLYEPQASNRSVESTGGIVDDWFESASEVSGPRQVLPWAPDDITPSPVDANIFRRSLFQLINDNNTVNVEHRPTAVPLIVTNDEKKAKRLTTPRMSESDIFVRTPEPEIPPSSLARSTPSPVAKKHQTDTLAVTSHQSSKTMAHPSASRLAPASN